MITPLLLSPLVVLTEMTSLAKAAGQGHPRASVGRLVFWGGSAPRMLGHLFFPPFRGGHERPSVRGRCRAVELSGHIHVPLEVEAGRLYSGNRAATPNLTDGIASQIDLEKGMANLSLLTELAANEAWEALAAVEATSRHWRESLADGHLDTEEAAEGLRLLEVAIKEAREAKLAAEVTHSRNRAAETLTRADSIEGVFEFSEYRRGLLRDAGVRPVEMPDNVRQFPQSETGPVAS